MTQHDKEELAELYKWRKIFEQDRCWSQMDEVNNQINKLVNKEK